MGMDVMGRKPKSEKGEYFRNNVWWWRPLWNYVEFIAPDLVGDVNGQTNDGDGLNAPESEELSKRLLVSLENGACKKYEAEYNEHLSQLPTEPCKWCETTGIRRDSVGLENGMPTKELSSEVASMLGRTHGWCNGCDGMGWSPNWETHYPFSQDNVKEFAEFLAESGGFSIC